MSAHQGIKAGCASRVLVQTEPDISLFVYSCITSRGMSDEEEAKTVYSPGESGDSETTFNGQYPGIGSM